MFDKFRLLLKKPHLIRDVIYKKHLGIILSYDIAKISKNPATKSPKHIVEQSDNGVLIADFYKKMGRDSITEARANLWLQEGHHCWLTMLNGEVIGAMWIFFDSIKIGTLSARVLSKHKTIFFDGGTGYCAYVIIDPEHRDKGIFKFFNTGVLEYYRKQHNLDRVFLITGASNSAMIKACKDCSARLVGIVEVTNILGFVKRKELFTDNDRICWW